MFLDSLGLRLTAILKPWQRAKLLPLLAIGLLTIGQLLTGCSLPQVSAESRLFAPIALEFVDDYTLPPTSIKDVPVGGLSGLTYDAKQGVFYAISDDRSGFAPARFYTLTPKIGTDKTSGNLVIKTVAITATTPLTQADGKPYERNKIDTEGIALSPRGTVFISTEGDNRANIAPMVNEYNLTTGQWIQALPVPAAYVPSKTEAGLPQGVQNNKGFEGLAINTDATGDLFRVFAAIEQPLIQDRTLVQTPKDDPSAPPPIQADRLRMIHYALMMNRADLVGEYVYELDPAPMGTIEHGLSEIMALDNAGRFLALERSLGLAGFSAKLYQFSFAGAKDVQGMMSLQGLPADAAVIRKQLLFDLAGLGMTIDNVEGMALGPKLPDGSQSLWIVSDDNFDKDQVTQFLLFRIKPQAD
jgi:hypothetical protein